jgi:RHS repeat-associated protein
MQNYSPQEVAPMTAHRLAGILVAGLFFLHGGSASAQSCPPTNFTGTITVGDGSAPEEDFHLGAGHCCGWFIQTQGPGPSLSLSIWEALGWDIEAWGSPYFQEKRPASVNCVNDPPPNSCAVCTPAQMSFEMYALLGSFDGTAITLPSGVCSGAVLAGPLSAAIRESDCTYDFSRGQTPLRESNHWALYVYRAEGTTGPGYGTYTLSYGGVSTDATTWSSHNTTVNFCPVDFGIEPTDTRYYAPPTNGGSAAAAGPATAEVPPCPQEEPSNSTEPPSATAPPSSPGPSSCVGNPVSVVSGNMYFDQTDAKVLGLGGLTFARSYNSANRAISSTLFGGGWFSTFEKRLEVQSSSLLKLRRGNGVAAYFSDPQGDLRFDATLPLSRESWIVKQPDGTYVRYFRKGGTEAYDAAGRLTTMVDANGNVTTLAYDGSFRLQTITAPSGRALTLAYVNNRPSTLSGPAGLIATYSYDASGRLQGVLYNDVAASGYTFTYDPSTGAVATVADLSGRFIEKHAYDGTGKASTSEIADGRELYTFTYQPTQTVVTDALGNTTTYEYATFGGQRRVTRIVGQCNGCPSGTETGRWTYSDWSATATNPIGKVTTYAYKPGTGDLLSVTQTGQGLTRSTTYTYDTQGRVLTVAAADGGLTTYTYVTAGPDTITEKVTDTSSRTTRIGYTTPQGQLETITSPRSTSEVATLAYSATTRDLLSVTVPNMAGPLATFTYDTMGRPKDVKDGANNTTTYVYDALGRVTKVTDPALKDTTYTYDKGGRLLTIKDALMRTTTYAYDDYGRLATVTDANTPPNAGVTTYGYDLMSNLTSLTDARGKVTGFEYDAYNRVKKVIWPGDGSVFETFTYDAAGRLETRTNRKGVITTYEYDDLDRLIGKSYSDGTAATNYTVDPVGRPLTAGNGTDTLTWAYDLAGQLRSEQSQKNSSLVEFDYDLAGNRISLKLGGQLVLSYVSDGAGRLTSMARGGTTWTLGYDAASRRATLAHPNGVTTTYGYDVVSRLTSAATKKGNQSRTSSTYTYDFTGNRLTKGGDFAETYTYDPLYRLTLVKRGNTTTESYGYDKVGNRLSALNSSPWAYNDWNELQSLPGATYTYDPNGNMATKVDATGSWTYEWNAENQLTRVLNNGTEVARYAYDPLGRRVEKVVGGGMSPSTGVTTSLYDGEDILRQTSGTTTTTYIHGPGIDEPLASENASGVRTYLHADGLGSIVKTTNSSGAAVSTFKYNAFGALESGAPAPYAFTGREWEAESGLYYYRSRYYDPRIGRFLSEDPLQWRLTLNLYAYVRNNPVRWIDPFGLKEEEAGGFLHNAWDWVKEMAVTVAAALSHIPEAVAKSVAGQMGTKALDAGGPIVEAGGAALQGEKAALEAMEVMKRQKERREEYCAIYGDQDPSTCARWCPKK